MSFLPGGAYGPMDDFLFHIHRGMLEFVGYRVLDPVSTYAPARMTGQERTAALSTVSGSIAARVRVPRADRSAGG